MLNLLAHAGEEHAETTEQTSGLLDALTHQPVWASLLIIAFVLFGVYALLEKFGIKPLNRVIAIVPLLILIAILYMEHNPAVSTVVLSVGFVASFILAFTMMSAKQKDSPKDKNGHGKPDETP